MTDRNDLAGLIRDTIQERSRAYTNDDDPLDYVTIDGSVDLLCVADAVIAAGWRCALR